MTFIIVGAFSFSASLLTFFSGFGLGTVLLPVFAIWYPLEMAVAMTALVHLVNNLFKFYLVRRSVDWRTLVRFGVPAFLFSLVGAYLLEAFSKFPALLTYNMGDQEYHVLPVKLVISVLMIVFTLFEIVPYLKSLRFQQSLMPLGGALSGFFGGLSGHQGALRSAFLVRSDLGKEQIIATGTTIACLVDLGRLFIYWETFLKMDYGISGEMLGVALVAAASGAFVGFKFINKVTLVQLQKIVAFGLLLMAAALGSGVL